MHKIENGKATRPYTKQDIIDYAKRSIGINLDGVNYDLDGHSLATYLMSLGFDVVEYSDRGTHGRVITAEGVVASTSGALRFIPKKER